MGSSISDNCNSDNDNLTNTCCPSESTAAQESSIFGNISNLSAVESTKDASILQGFPETTSLSPLLNRQQQLRASSSGYFPDNADLQKADTVLGDPGIGSSSSHASIAQKGNHAPSTVTQLQSHNAFTALEKLLFASDGEELVDSISIEHINDVPTSSAGVMDANQVSHIQNGGLRRCLQFDDCQGKLIFKSSGDTTERQISISDMSPSFSPDAPYDSKEAGHSGLASTICLPSNPAVAVVKPGGIGLHLNSIVSGPQLGKKSSKGMVKLKGKSLIISGGGAHVITSNNNVAVEMTTPDKLPVIDNANPPDLPLPLNQAGEEFAESTGESKQANSNKGRSRASSSASPDGCKRCSCKKSKCLKLYCDCFTSGYYCDDSCSCKGCLNRTELKDTVLGARQLVECRNPNAFAPKILQDLANSPTNSAESVEPVAPPSLRRHKRGCNCRKSMCLKKYCECYEANVGCSEGCRCEGCENAHGKKPGYTLSRHVINKRPFDDFSSEETPDQKRKLSRSHLSPDNKMDDLPLAEAAAPSPPSDSRKKGLKSLRPGRRYLLSTEANQHTPPSATRLTPPSARGGLINLCQLTNSTLQAPPSSKTRTVQEDTTENDDTPLILRDLPAPAKSVKGSSPNTKRISPPHNRANDLRPSSSGPGELTRSRKFVFRSVSMFPCLDSSSPSDPPADTH